MIKNIIFDLSEVIISGYRGIEEVVLESQYGTFENQKILENEVDLDSMRENEVFLNLLRGKLTEKEYLNHVLKQSVKEACQINVLLVTNRKDQLLRCFANFMKWHATYLSKWMI